eukprot:gene24739-biopygen10202
MAPRSCRHSIHELIHPTQQGKVAPQQLHPRPGKGWRSPVPSGAFLRFPSLVSRAIAFVIFFSSTVTLKISVEDKSKTRSTAGLNTLELNKKRLQNIDGNSICPNPHAWCSLAGLRNGP